MKFLRLCPKALPKGEGEALLLRTCLADEVFPCYTMQLNVFWGIGGEEAGGVRISTNGKKVVKCAFTAMISISAVSMPYSLCCETYHPSLLASLHRPGCTCLLESQLLNSTTDERRDVGAIKH